MTNLINYLTIDYFTNILNGTQKSSMDLTTSQILLIHTLMTNKPDIFVNIQTQINKLIDKKSISSGDIPTILYIIVEEVKTIKNIDVNLYDAVEILALVIISILIEINMANGITEQQVFNIIKISMNLLKTNISNITEIEKDMCNCGCFY